jgi:hypothetical protein
MYPDDIITGYAGSRSRTHLSMTTKWLLDALSFFWCSCLHRHPRCDRQLATCICELASSPHELTHFPSRVHLLTPVILIIFVPLAHWFWAVALEVEGLDLRFGFTDRSQRQLCVREVHGRLKRVNAIGAAHFPPPAIDGRCAVGHHAPLAIILQKLWQGLILMLMLGGSSRLEAMNCDREPIQVKLRQLHGYVYQSPWGGEHEQTLRFPYYALPRHKSRKLYFYNVRYLRFSERPMPTFHAHQRNCNAGVMHGVVLF